MEHHQNKKRKAEAVGEEKFVTEEVDADKEESTANDDNKDSNPTATAAKLDIDLTKPLKKARTPYFIFSDDNRAAIQAKVNFSFGLF